MKILIADEGKVWAYRDADGNEVTLGSEIYLGKNDDGSRYYQIEVVSNGNE